MGDIDQFMQQFMQDMTAYVDRVRKAAYAESVVFMRSSRGVVVTVYWRNKSGEKKEWQKVFTMEELLGNTRHHPKHLWRIQKGHCACYREIVVGTLQARGAL